MNPYDVLNVRKNASKEDITLSFNKLVEKYDLKNYVGDPYFAQKRLKEIDEAYAILSNPQKRREYDKLHDIHVELHKKEKINNDDVFTPYYKKQNTSEHIHNDAEIAQDKYNKFNIQTSNEDPISNKKSDYTDILNNPISDHYSNESYNSFDDKNNNNSKNMLFAIIKFFIFIYILSIIFGIANIIIDFIFLF